MKYEIYIDDPCNPREIQDVILKAMRMCGVNVLVLNVRHVGLSVNRVRLEVSEKWGVGPLVVGLMPPVASIMMHPDLQIKITSIEEIN